MSPVTHPSLAALWKTLHLLLVLEALSQQLVPSPPGLREEQVSGSDTAMPGCSPGHPCSRSQHVLEVKTCYLAVPAR